MRDEVGVSEAGLAGVGAVQPPPVPAVPSDQPIDTQRTVVRL